MQRITTWMVVLAATAAVGPAAKAGENSARAAGLKELMAPEHLLARGQSRVYRGDHLSAISLPVGGIGGGNVQINGKGERPIWQIFNNMDQASIPNSFFAVRAAAGAADPVVRAVQTAAVGPFAAMKSLTFRGEYPFGWFDFQEPALPVHVSMEVFSPLIPLDAKDSALPCAIYNLTAENISNKPVAVSFLATQQNAVGYHAAAAARPSQPARAAGGDGRDHPGYGGNRNAVLWAEGAAILHMTAGASGKTPGSGDMALAATGGEPTAVASWESLEQLAADFAQNGSLAGTATAGPTPAGRTVDGALTAAVTLAPGETKTVSFLLAWYFPNGSSGAVPRLRSGPGQETWLHQGRMYANWWSDALDVARYLHKHLDVLTGRTRAYHDALYETNLPYYALDRISSQVACLVSQTCFWTKDGYFGGWEGCRLDAGCCAGNCAHVWHYAQAHARLFPEIGRRMRAESLSDQNEAGGIPFRQPSGKVAFDGQCGEILGAYREHLCSADRKWLDRQWPRIRKAMDYVVATWDEDQDGVPKGQQHNTLDAELSGSSSWLGTMYLAALAATEKMARLEGRTDLARRYRRIRLAGATKQDATLFNGAYYIQIPDQAPEDLEGENYLTGCHIDQLLGQWWAHRLDLGWLYPPDHVRTALQSLFRYNFRTHFDQVPTYTTGSPARGRPRKFVYDDDYAMIMTTWPKDGRPAPGKALRFADEVMSGFEYSAAATMVSSGLVQEALAVVRAAADRYDGRLRTGLTDRAWGFSGNPFGDDECGKFYARPMSIWSLLTACQGFVYDGPAGLIGFRPVWKPADHVSFFTAAEGWGVFQQQRAGGEQTESITLRYGRLAVRSMVFELADTAGASKVAVTVNGKPVEADHELAEGRLTIRLSSPLSLHAGEALAVAVE